MKKIHIITGASVYRDPNLRQEELLNSFFNRLTDSGFNFFDNGKNFFNTLLRCIHLTRSIENISNNLNSIFILRGFGNFFRQTGELYEYKVLRINPDKESSEDLNVKFTQKKPIFSPAPEIDETNVKMFEKQFQEIFEANSSLFEVLDVNINELDDRFEEISNFFSELKNN